MPRSKDDGGYWALAGFLYQIVGMLSHGDGEVTTSAESGGSGTSIDAYLMLDVGSRYHAEHEMFGQDAAFINSDDEVVLVQFKYSTTDRKIDKPGLKKILKKLDESSELVSQDGFKVSACVLATNRDFTAPASGLWQVEDKKDRKYKLRHHHNTMEDYVNKLVEFGRILGALENEIDSGINQLIGKILKETGSKQSKSIISSDEISIENLKEAFTSEPGARQIIREKVEEKVEQSLTSFMRDEKGAHGSFQRRRAVLDEIGKACNLNAIIVLHGPGGCGKTVSLWQWAQETDFVGIKTTTNLGVYPMAEEVCDWAELLATHNWRREREEITLERIKAANPTCPDPIFHLALDGIDEERRIFNDREINRIIDWFIEEDSNAKTNGRPPAAVLVVTCRAIRDFSSNWYRSVLGHGRRYQPAKIAVDKFTVEELRELIDIPDDRLSKKVRNMIRAGLGTETTFDSEFDTLGSPSKMKYGEFKRVNGEVMASIHHPVIFGSFLLLDMDSQEGVLLGNDVFLNKLATEVVSRFIEKVIDRNRLPDRDDRDLGHALKQIALKNEPRIHKRKWFSFSDWEEPLVASRMFDNSSANRLYKETESGGLIHLDSPDRWQWTHSWIHKYLISDN